MTEQCPICNSQNIIFNNILQKKLCNYCFLNYCTEDYHVQLSENEIFKNFNELFIDTLDNTNPVLISSNQLIKNKINANIFDIREQGLFNLKTGSKFLSKGKISQIIIPDISHLKLIDIFNAKSLYSNNVLINIGIFTPNFIKNNQEKIKNLKYIYSLFTVSKICEINNFDIYDISSNINYMLLNIKMGRCENDILLNKLQKLWNEHLFSGIFKDLE